MPPRRSAAASATAGGGGQGPTLKLIVDKGPLSGSTSEFRPGTAVKIGRLVRGNTLAIKDSGISSKHLLIQAEEAPDPSGRRWTVSDLDSSNGSFLNGAQLEPFEAAGLSHGDVIKIGEETSIRVEILSGEGNDVVSVVRRNTRRRVKEQVVDLGVIDEFAELGLQNNVDEEKIEVEVNQGRNANTRTTRNSARSKNLAQDLNVEEDKVVSTRMTRNSARNLKLAMDLNVEEDNGLEPSEIKGSRGVSTRRKRREDNVEETVVDSSLIDGKKATRGRGRGRNKLIVETICEETENEDANRESEEKEKRSDTAADEVRSSGVEECVAAGATASSVLNVEEDNDLGPSEIKGSGGVSTRRKRMEDNVEETVVDSSLIEGKKATIGRGRGRGRNKLIVETICEETENEEANRESEDKEKRSDIAADEVRSSGVEECVAAGATTSKGEMVADLSKMTLGEWLDFVAVYEPQQIIAETEEMLAEMRRKAERCHEFMLQQKKAQGLNTLSK